MGTLDVDLEKMDCLKNDMRIKGVRMEMKRDRMKEENILCQSHSVGKRDDDDEKKGTSAILLTSPE
jgi:hypothetical protein